MISRLAEYNFLRNILVIGLDFHLRKEKFIYLCKSNLEFKMHCKKILKFLNNKLVTSSRLFVLLLPFWDNKNLRKKGRNNKNNCC